MAIKDSKSFRDAIYNLLVRQSAVSVSSLLASIIGFIANVVILYDDFKRLIERMTHAIYAIFSSLIHSAQAQQIQQVAQSSENNHFTMRDALPPLMIIGVFFILIGCIYIVAIKQTTKQADDRAWDMIKIIAGFFIGNITSAIR